MHLIICKIVIIYIIYSFTTLLCILGCNLILYDTIKEETVEIKPFTKVALALYWPVTLYLLIKEIKFIGSKGNNDE